MIEYELPQGSGPKKPNKKLKLTSLQYEIYKKCYDDVNGPLFFASHCCWVNRNGLVRYVPFDYQREMLFNLHNYQNTISLWSRQNGKCCLGSNLLKIRNKHTGDIKEVSFTHLFALAKEKK